MVHNQKSMGQADKCKYPDIFFKKICNILRVFSSSDAKLFMMKGGGSEQQVTRIRFGEGVLLRMYKVYMMRKGEVLNLKVMGGTRRH